jgi:hypothetical protein
MALLRSLISRETLLPRNETNFNWLAANAYIYQRREFVADVAVEMAVVTTAVGTIPPTQQTIHPTTPIVKLRLLQIPTSSNTMRTPLFLP